MADRVFSIASFNRLYYCLISVKVKKQQVANSNSQPHKIDCQYLVEIGVQRSKGTLNNFLNQSGNLL